MYILKGFAVNPTYVSNAQGVVSAIGELSDRSKTFSQEKGYYKNDTISQDALLVAFTSATDGTFTQIDTALRDRILAILAYVYTQVATKQQLYTDTLAQNLLTNFQSTAQGFSVGPIIQSADGMYWAPSWISWTDTALAGSVLKVWFNDPAFQAQFDDTAFIIVPPLDNIDDFFKLGTQVQTLIDAYTPTAMITKINTARANQPETDMTLESYNYIDPNNSSHTIQTNWGVLIYGPAGNTVDAKKQAIIDYILANSAYTRDKWVAILPDLFLRTEVIMIPLFDQYAQQADAVNYGTYRTCTNIARAVALFQAQVVDTTYPAAQVTQYLNIMGHPWRSLQVLSCGSTENRNNQFQLTDFFPDIIDVSSTSTDFGRMSANTRQFLLYLDTMIQTAETMTATSSIPQGFTRLTRNGMLYIVVNYLNVDFLVMAKINLTQVIPPLTSSSSSTSTSASLSTSLSSSSSSSASTGSSSSTSTSQSLSTSLSSSSSTSTSTSTSSSLSTSTSTGTGS